MNIRLLGIGLLLGAALSSAHAQSDARKGYIVQLKDAPAASYTGGVAGLAATRPAAGARFNVGAAAVQAYLGYLNTRANAVASTVPSAQVYGRYGVVLNGFAARLTDAEVKKLAATPGVLSVTPDEARQMDTNYTPSFLGINKSPSGVWNRTDASGQLVKGEGVVIAHVDGGVWPEDPSFSDKVDGQGKPVPSHQPGTVVYNPLPAGKYTGICETGPGFNTSHCNNKLVGARVFNAGWKANRTPGQLWAFEYLDSPRDADGHGSHTLSTSGGNENVDVVVAGSPIRSISGIAPRARVAAYKVCFNGNLGPGVAPSGCFPSDSIAAINQAVADGADVINYSISGSETSFVDPVETAFRNAAAAGVFVSASAGNRGPGNTVAHLSPWLMTVGNSTHDRFTVAKVTLGNGATASGPSFQTQGVLDTPLILATEAGVTAFASLTNTDKLALARCYTASDRATLGGSAAAALDPVKVAGKVVVCYRGGNVLVNKTQEVKDRGGAGVIIQNLPANLLPAPLNGATANTTFNIAHVVPTVHLVAADAAAVVSYATGGAGRVTFAPSEQLDGVPAPVMADSSSRGPNKGDLDVLKPDITAPGTDIIAAFANRGLTLAERDAVAAGTLVPGPWADMISGTSMASPHVAGAGALLKQANPTWSPYAIKSALMTSALQNVKLANGNPDTARFGFGSGHLNPNDAVSTSLVYDSTNADHAAYAAGVLPGGDLNLASMTRGNVLLSTSFTRTLTNKGSSSATYAATAQAPGFTVSVSPQQITLAPGASQTFAVTATRTSAPYGSYAFGDVTWTDASNASKTVRSPLTLKPEAILFPSTIADTRTTGGKVYTVLAGFNGSMSITPTGLVPAIRFSGAVTTEAVGPNNQCFAFAVPSGARLLRVQMFNVDTTGGASTDIDLVVARNGAQIAASEGGTTDELISLTNPTASNNYLACAVAFNTGRALANYVINVWVVNPPSGPQSLKAFGPASVVGGGTASIGLQWNVPAGNRYIGLVDYRNPPNAAVLGTALVMVDPFTGLSAVQASATPQNDTPAHKLGR